jgi:hypothetical protein
LEERVASIFRGKEYAKQSSAFYLLHAGFLFGVFFGPEDEGDMFLRNVS